MTTSLEREEVCQTRRQNFGNLISTGDGSGDEAGRSMQVLERLAATLDIPVATFFDPEVASEEASAQDVAELTRSFLAITDPVMRRYCLDVVRAAGA